MHYGVFDIWQAKKKEPVQKRLFVSDYDGTCLVMIMVVLFATECVHRYHWSVVDSCIYTHSEEATGEHMTGPGHEGIFCVVRTYS